MKKRGLGRSLNAILSTNAVAQPPEPTQLADEVAVSAPAPSTPPAENQLQQLPLEQLQRGQYQPRREMDQATLEDLAGSIKSQGILQPIIVRKLAEKKYEIIAGERRCRAADLAGLDTVPAIVREIPDETAMAIGLIENIQRENLNPIDEAGALQRLLEEFGMTHQEVAEAVGRSRASVSNMLRLLNLQPAVRRLVEHGDIEMGHARALLALSGEAQVRAAQQVAEKGLSVRETEALVKQLGEPKKAVARQKSINPEVSRLQKSFAEKLQTNVVINHRANGRGRIEIRYKDLSELDSLLERI